MKRIAATQLALLVWAKKGGKKGFTVDEAAAGLKAPRQSVAVRLDDAIARGWLSHKWEKGNGGAPRSRFAINVAGLKVLKTKWLGKGRFRQAASA